MGKIETRKFAKDFECLFVVCSRCLNYVRKFTDVLIAYSDGITVVPHSSEDSLESRRIVTAKSRIRLVLTIRAWAKIGSAIIKTVTVSVVNLFTISADNLAVHSNLTIPIAPKCVKTKPNCLAMSDPVPFREPLIVGSVYDGILSLRERDQAVGWIERLSNGMALVLRTALSGHVLTSNENLVSVAILT
jgi:hypothetical protein